MQRIIPYIMENKSHVPNHQIKKKNTIDGFPFNGGCVSLNQQIRFA
jgi:hypothetical protein